MKTSIRDLSKDELDKLEWVMFPACQSFEPWADMMNLSGAGDPGIENFPLDLDDIESIDISLVSREEAPGPVAG
jgi:hypothetical protein